MKSFRCKNCNKLLFEGEYIGTVKKKCPKCKDMNTFDIENNINLNKFCNVNKIN